MSWLEELEGKLAYEFITHRDGKESTAYHLIYLFAKLVELTSYVKAAGLPAEQSINRATLTRKLTVQVMNVLVYVSQLRR